MTRARIESISPSLIVSNVTQTIAFYREKLGFETMYEQPEGDPFFAIVRRDGVMIFLKAHGSVEPMPNCSRHPWIKWDAYVYVPDPDALAAEFAGNGLEFHKPLTITSENLRGFEVRDPDGYVLFFGRPYQERIL
ncbi:MAG TPA: VOC family protein [Terracidiphilus sp.]|jgi:catechol 2,3-dioxygenase-like lactoylglutathione lyase family enzyme|nr:VOC family protein [Terracidiphilus sp.]